MGIGGISIWQLLIVLAIVVMLFGTKRLRTLGSDLGEAIKGFRSSMTSEEPDSPTEEPEEPEGESAQLKEQSDKNE
jgi:sec-independent protein translocase protein TatA